VVAVGEAGCFLLNALSYVAMLYALCRISVPSGHHRNDRIPFLTRTVEGVSYLRDHPVLLRLILAIGCISLLGLPYFFLLPGFAKDVLHVDARKLGYLTASVSVGGLVGGLLMRSIAERFDKHLVVAAAGLLFWAFLFAFTRSRSYWLSAALLMGLGFFLVLTISTVNNLLQIATPPEMRGRVMSIQGIAVNGLAPVGSLLAGGMAQLTSLPTAVAILALTGAAATAACLLRPRRQDSLEPALPSAVIVET
jgi:predicted MFS family arabinose efflux permease